LGAAAPRDDGQLVLGGDLDDGADLFRRVWIGDYSRDDPVYGEASTLLLGRNAADGGDLFARNHRYGQQMGSLTLALARHSPSAEDRARG